jgi:hypothetical protein
VGKLWDLFEIEVSKINQQKKENAMKLGEVFHSKYLKAEDLQGKTVRVVIQHVDLEDVGLEEGKKERKLVCYFVGKERQLVLNKTNAESIAEITGCDDTDDWAGAPIALFPDKTKFGGKTVPCIRITWPDGKPVPPPVTNADGDDLNF